MALAAEGTFVARCVFAEPKQLASVLEAAARHKGTSFIEIRQNCVVFNENVLENFADREDREEHWLRLEPGKPVRFGKDGGKGIVLRGLTPSVATIGVDGVREEDLLVHDPHCPSPLPAYLLARLQPPDFPTALGIFRQVEKPTYNDLLMSQIDGAIAQQGKGDLSRLFNAGTTWFVD